jgi:hypothetical protein
MKKTFTYKIVFWSWIGTIALLVLIFFASCAKEQTYIEHPHEHHDSALFVVNLGADQFIIKVECWGTGIWGYGNDTFLTPAYDVTDPANGRMIFYRRYVVKAFIDCKWEYCGWNTVQDTNFVDLGHLKQDTIELSPCN